MALTKNDLLKISLLMNGATSELKEELLTELKAEFSHLPSKKEYYKREDEMMGKLKKIEEDLAVLSDHSSNHSDRIEDLEKLHPQNKHYAVA